MNYMSNEKDMIIHLMAGWQKRLNWMKLSCIKMSQYFPKPYEPFGGDTNIKVDLSRLLKEIINIITNFCYWLEENNKFLWKLFVLLVSIKNFRNNLMKLFCFQWIFQLVSKWFAIQSANDLFVIQSANKYVISTVFCWEMSSVGCIQ